MKARQYKTVTVSFVQNCKFYAALHALLTVTAEFMLSKRPVLRFTVALLFFRCHQSCSNSNFDTCIGFNTTSVLVRKFASLSFVLVKSKSVL